MIRPLILATWSFGTVGTSPAWGLLSEGGSAINAVECAATAIENDPSIDSVGFGGLPDIGGAVVLDAAIMESTRRWGSILGLSHFRNPCSIARRLMDRCGTAMRVASGAESFAREEGFEPEDLLTHSAHSWWKNHSKHGPGSPAFHDAGDGTLFLRSGGGHDTVGIVALDINGCLAAATSTSGLPLKPKGRIGDSAILGHGLYVEPSVGAVAATGTGELISSHCAAVRIIDALDSTKCVEVALRRVLERLARSSDPNSQAAFICVTPDGKFGGGSLREGFCYSVHSEDGPAIRQPEVLIIPS